MMMRRLAARKSRDDLLSSSSSSSPNRRTTLIITHDIDDDAAAKSTRQNTSFWRCRHYNILSSRCYCFCCYCCCCCRSYTSRLKQSTISCLSSFYRRLKNHLMKIDPIYAAIICIFLFVTLCTVIVLFVTLLVGPRGSTKGGILGEAVDLYLKDYTRYCTMSKWRHEVQFELHLPIVYRQQQQQGGGSYLIDQLWHPFGDSLSSRPNYAVVDMLLREKRRKYVLGKLIHDAIALIRNNHNGDDVNRDNNGCSKLLQPKQQQQQQREFPAVMLQLQTSTNGQQQLTRLLPYWLTSIPKLNGLKSAAVTVDYFDIIDTTAIATDDDDDLLADQLHQLLELFYSQENKKIEKTMRTKEERTSSTAPSSLSIISQSIQNCSRFVTIKDNYAVRTDPILHCLGYVLGGMQIGDDDQLLHRARPYITKIFSTPSSSYEQQQLVTTTNNGDGASSSSSSSSCHSNVGYAVLSHTPTPADQVRKSSSIWNHVSTILSAFPSQHPAYLCLPPLYPNNVGISPYNTANEELSFQSTFVNKLLTAYEGSKQRLVNSNNSSSTSSSSSSSSESLIWGVATLSCEVNDSKYDGETNFPRNNCCNQVSVTMLESTTEEGESVNFDRHHYYLKNNEAKRNISSHDLFFTFVGLPLSDDDRSGSSSGRLEMIDDPMQVSVSISERTQQRRSSSSSMKQVQQYKESIQMKMRRKSWMCEPGWLCNRCIKASFYGSFSKCYSVCGRCATELICNEREERVTQTVIDVKVTGLNLPKWSVTAKSTAATATDAILRNTVGHHHQRIPRIIHQTYFEEISKERYPQLFRLQNTWKASGWEYRFYSDDTAREYIRVNYPERFVSVFDALLPGAYKADFFRYLILFKDGGIYADIDVMLDANLEKFITPDLAFFSPLDSVAGYADENFCLWNGLIGSAPTHPILANVIEWMVNLVSSRGDLYDIERTVCEVTGVDKLENWKIRAEPGLMISGPCALGIAANNALGKGPLSKFVPGLTKQYSMANSASRPVHRENDDVVGDVMIMIADKTDLGSFRFNDPERNIFFASTDMPGLSKAPLVYEKRRGARSVNKNKEKKLLPHYSVTTHGDALWGTHDVYADAIARSDRVKMQIHYE